jgi:hypothetical protein
MKKIFILVVVFVALLGLGIMVAQAYSEGILSEDDTNEYSREGNLIIGDRPTTKGAEETKWGGCWYRDEFGRLFNVNEHHDTVVSICMRRGDYPSKIFASDQQSLELTDAELEACGYKKTIDGDWER